MTASSISACGNYCKHQHVILLQDAAPMFGGGRCIIAYMVLPKQKAARKVLTQRVTLADGRETTVHVLRVSRKALRLRVVRFDRPTRLLDWCQQHAIPNAINGGFFGNDINGAENGAPVGEVWINGQKIAKTMTQFDRGCVYISKQGEIRIGPRSTLPKRIDGDLLEVGPLLINEGKPVLELNDEGFSAEANFFDNDVTIGRAQRVAIACDSDTIWMAVCEGRSPTEAGFTLGEMADFLKSLGARDALNLDGGSGSSLVIDHKLINKPRMGADRNFREFPRGREIVTAIILE